MRLRLTFAKTAAMRFTGHMDLHRTLERTLRRAQLPITLTQGYTARAKLQIASALPLGVTGENELADIWLDEEIPPADFIRQLNAAAPPGIALHAAQPVDEHAPKLQQAAHSSEFIVTLLEPIPELDQALARVQGAAALPRERRGKAYDLRPLILALARLPDDEEGCQKIGMTLLTREAATGRPDEVVAALGGDPLAARYHRTKIHLL
jgi:radical SAM-linked protein